VIGRMVRGDFLSLLDPRDRQVVIRLYGGATNPTKSLTSWAIPTTTPHLNASPDSGHKPHGSSKHGAHVHGLRRLPLHHAIVAPILTTSGQTSAADIPEEVVAHNPQWTQRPQSHPI